MIAGYTEPQGSRKFFGALLLGVYEDGKLRYCGRVGTGFERSTLLSTFRQLEPLTQTTSPFERLPAGMRRAGTHWVKPQLVAEISFAEWTGDGLVRQAVFHGLRTDKPAQQIEREKAVSTPSNGKVNGKAVNRAHMPSRDKPSSGDDRIQNIKITHPDRIIDPTTGLTKLDLVRYHEQIADRILPFLQNRPVYLLRCPEGIEGEHFFQKHINRIPIPGLVTLDQSLDPEHEPLMVIETAHALIGAAQMGAIELHTCNATADKIDKPDCMVFDLDPDPSLPWKRVAEGAQLVKVVLDELGLKSFLKTSGGKGLHLVVPPSRRHSWDDVTAFSQAVAQHLARTLPKHFSAKMGEKNRVGKIFIDYLRNRRQASTVAPYSVRARPGLPVAVPIGWEVLKEIDSARMWTVMSLPEWITGAAAADPWHDYFESRQKLTAPMKKQLAMRATA